MLLTEAIVNSLGLSYMVIGYDVHPHQKMFVHQVDGDWQVSVTILGTQNTGWLGIFKTEAEANLVLTTLTMLR